MNNEYLDRAKQKITDPQILSIVVGKRAKQLAFGARPMVKTDDKEFMDIALLEIAEGLLSYSFPTAEELAAELAAEQASANVDETTDEEVVASEGE